MLYVKSAPRSRRRDRNDVRQLLKRLRWRKERATVRGSVAALPREAAQAWQAACDLDIARELVAIVAEE